MRKFKRKWNTNDIIRRFLGGLDLFFCLPSSSRAMCCCGAGKRNQNCARATQRIYLPRWRYLSITGGVHWCLLPLLRRRCLPSGLKSSNRVLARKLCLIFLLTTYEIVLSKSCFKSNFRLYSLTNLISIPNNSGMSGRQRIWSSHFCLHTFWRSFV